MTIYTLIWHFEPIFITFVTYNYTLKSFLLVKSLQLLFKTRKFVIFVCISLSDSYIFSLNSNKNWEQKTRWFKSPAWVFIQDLQDLLVGPTGGGLDKRYNTTSVVHVELLSHAGRGALDSGWAGWGGTAQRPPLKWGGFKGGRGRRGQRRKRRRKEREKNKEKILSATNWSIYVFTQS